MTDSPEFVTKAEADAHLRKLMVEENWDRGDLKVESRVHPYSCDCGACEHAREVDEKVRLDIATAMPSDEDVSIGADDDDGPEGPHFTAEENREHADWLASERE